MKVSNEKKHGYCRMNQFHQHQNVIWAYCVWWGQEGKLYHKLLKPDETITAVRYKQQVMKLNQALKKKASRIRQTS